MLSTILHCILRQEMNLFYHPDARLGNTVSIEPAEALHITKVFRKRDGDTIQITDGAGSLFDATLTIDGRRTSALIAERIRTDETKIPLEIAISPTKNNERLEWFIEKAVEIGIGKISLIECDHSERVHVKQDRLQRVAISAMKQSLKLHLPEITEIQNFDSWVKNAQAEIKCIAHCYDDADKRLLKNVLNAKEHVCIAIGPEGDFSKKEIELAVANGFMGVGLGNSRLRTETAALVAVHTFELNNQ